MASGADAIDEQKTQQHEEDNRLDVLFACVWLLAAFAVGWLSWCLLRPQVDHRSSREAWTQTRVELRAATTQTRSEEETGSSRAGGVGHDVCTQSQVTYTRWRSSPRFLPLADQAHGGWGA